jgi:hypothetical protein
MKSASLLSMHCPDFGNGRFRPILPGDGEIGKALDTIGGIDGYQIWGLGMRGIAMRTQRDDHRSGYPYRTHTIREIRPSGEKTEYEKRLWGAKQKKVGVLFPYWSAHAYLTSDGSHILCIGLAKTEELYPWIKRCEQQGISFQRRSANNGKEQFLYVPWDMYKQSGLYFFEYPHRGEEPRVLKKKLKIELNAIQLTLQYQEEYII